MTAHLTIRVRFLGMLFRLEEWRGKPSIGESVRLADAYPIGCVIALGDDRRPYAAYVDDR